MNHKEALKVQKGDKVTVPGWFIKNKFMEVQNIQTKKEKHWDAEEGKMIIVDVCYFFVYLYGHGNEWVHEQKLKRCDRD